MINDNLIRTLIGAIVIGIIIGFSYFLLDNLERSLQALNQTEAAQRIGMIKSALVMFLDSLLSSPEDIIKIVAFVIFVIFTVFYIYKRYL